MGLACLTSGLQAYAPQKGRAWPSCTTCVLAPYHRTLSQFWPLVTYLSDFFLRRDGVSIRPYRRTLSTKKMKKNDDLHFKRFFQCFSFLIDVPSGKKRRKFLINVPFVRFSLFTYPPGRFFLSALFLRGPSAGSGPVRLKGT